MKGSFNRTWLRLIRPRPRLAMLACAGLLCAIVAPVLDAAPAGAAPIASSFAQVFEDDFSATTVNQAVWRVFQDPTQKDDHSGKNVVVHNGMVTLSTAYDATLAKYTTAGMCLCANTSLMNQTYGEWEVRMRATAGDSRVLAMLWPLQGWPPEIDFVEMGGSGVQAARQLNTQTVHYNADNEMIHSSHTDDYTQWHTLGVQWGPGYVRYLEDGTVTGTVASIHVPHQPMRLGLATLPNAALPTQPVTYDVDWVKQYRYTGGPGTIPAAPTDVAATGGDTSATVSWTAPADTGSSLLTGYTITAQPGGKTMTVPRSGNDDPKTTATFTGLTPGVSYSFTVTSNNPFGASSASLPTAAAAVTGTPPSVTAAPTASFTSRVPFGSTATSSDASVRVVWATTPGSTAICKQQVTRSDAAGAATALRASATATSIGDRISAPGSVGYTVTAVGCNGLSGAAAGPSYRYAVTQQNDPAVSYSGTWSTVACADCSGSSVAESRTAGASVTFPVTNAYAAALVVRAGPQQSTFKVYVDGTLVGTQNVTLSTAQNRFIAFTRTWPIPGNHTIKVVNNASSAAPVLDVDGLLSLSA